MDGKRRRRDRRIGAHTQRALRTDFTRKQENRDKDSKHLSKQLRERKDSRLTLRQRRRDEEYRMGGKRAWKHSKHIHRPTTNWSAGSSRRSASTGNRRMSFSCFGWDAVPPRSWFHAVPTVMGNGQLLNFLDWSPKLDFRRARKVSIDPDHGKPQPKTKMTKLIQK